MLHTVFEHAISLFPFLGLGSTIHEYVPSPVVVAPEARNQPTGAQRFSGEWRVFPRKKVKCMH